MSTFNDLITFTRSTTGTYLDSVVYGDELVTNGGFSDGTTGWSAAYQSTISVVNGALRVTATNHNPYATQDVVVESGKEYVVTFDTGAKTSGNTTVFFGSETGLNKSDLGSQSSQPNSSYSVNVVATTDVLNLQFIGATMSVGDYFEVDNVSVKEVIGGQGTAGNPMLRTAAINEPRLEYDSQGNPLGLLVEEARTNHVTQSAVTSAEWVKVGAVTTTDREDNALGIFNGTAVGSNGAAWSRVKRNITVTSGTVYSGTFFYKEGTSGRVRLVMRANGLESVISGEQGSIAVVQSNAGAISVVSEEDYGGIRKVTFKWTPNYTGAAEIGLGAGSTVAGEDVILYAAQLEAGEFPTAYIPTEASTVTRAAEGVRVTLSDFYYRQKHGTIVIEFASKYDESVAGYNRPWELGNLATDVNRMFTYVTGVEKRLYNRIYDNDVDQFLSSVTAELPNNTGVYSKAALAWQTDDAQDSYNGNAGNTDTSVALTQERDTLAIMGRPTYTGNRLSGHVKSIQYYPIRLSEERLEQVTA